MLSSDMNPATLPPLRLFFILARSAPVAVIFRRGPSAWTQLIKWNTESDTFEYGHWFKGRIYVRRCDLSPEGDLLIYFVSKHRKRTIADTEGYTYAWTAVSKPPWLTALALWPKGDCWHGGGLFEDDKTLMLNHWPQRSTPHPRHLPPEWLTVRPNPFAIGEDDPIYGKRLTRDGWQEIQKWDVVLREHPDYFETLQPEIRELRHPSKAQSLTMTRSLSNTTYSERFAVTNQLTGAQTLLDDVGFASWDQRGRLVFVRDGKLFAGHATDDNEPAVDELADFNSQTPYTIESPEWARSW